MKKFLKSKNLQNLLWIAFGTIGGLNYYSREEYWISGILFLIAILYAYQLVKHNLNSKEN